LFNSSAYLLLNDLTNDTKILEYSFWLIYNLSIVSNLSNGKTALFIS